ncbi:hypothetical protein P692DRAFT_20881962 [Suillus brevipes Sb2]|nr:hypothetical protein P692DRAFT_20881962 [Suillus brevipes Sb2]
MPVIDNNTNTIIRNNIVVMTVDNLTRDWQTYAIDFTPDNPGPLKLVIRIKDTTPDSVSEHAVNAENILLAIRTIKYEEVERVICTDSEKILSLKANRYEDYEDSEDEDYELKDTTHHSAKRVRCLPIRTHPDLYDAKGNRKTSGLPPIRGFWIRRPRGASNQTLDDDSETESSEDEQENDA